MLTTPPEILRAGRTLLAEMRYETPVVERGYANQTLYVNLSENTIAATPVKRQLAVFETLDTILAAPVAFPGKDEARRFFLTLTQAFKDWHQAAWDSDAFTAGQARIATLLAEAADHA